MTAKPKFRSIQNFNDCWLQFQDLWAAVSLLNEPAGTVKMWAGTAENVPAGYLLLDGRSNLGTATYPALARVFGQAGATSFTLPDWRGKMPVGATSDQIAAKQNGALGSLLGTTGTDVLDQTFATLWIVKT